MAGVGAKQHLTFGAFEEGECLRAASIDPNQPDESLAYLHQPGDPWRQVIENCSCPFVGSCGGLSATRDHEYVGVVDVR